MLIHNTLTKNHQKGFTLLETLIAFVILSVGLLGIVSLQAMAKKFTHQAVQRSLAVTFTDSIVERIRANPSAMATYNTAAVGGGTITTEPSPNCTTGACSTTQLATHDLWKWEQSIDGAAATIGVANTKTAGLISPHACITFAPDTTKINTGFITVRVQWTGLNSLSDAVPAVGGTVCTGGAAAGDDPFRRQVTINTYVIDETEI